MAILGWRDGVPLPQVKAALAACALSAGLAVGWLSSGSLAVLAAAAAAVAVMNGYSKAYSP
jgi:hydrogenase/urease accessory protein HupE